MTLLVYMRVSSLSSRVALTYSRFIWEWINHSDDPERRAFMLGSYYDESSVDGGGPVSAVGGVLMKYEDSTWLEMDWYRVLDKFPALLRSKSGKPYVHMKEFGQHEALANFPVEERRSLFQQLTPLINRYKCWSIGSTLTPEEYRSHLLYLPKSNRITIHAACFMLVATVQAKLIINSKYPYKVPFMLDRGIPRKDADALDAAHRLITGQISEYQPEYDYRAGGLTWEDDREIPGLQVADIVAWTVRRDRARVPFENGGFESLREILAVKHLPAHFEEDWMNELDGDIRDKIKKYEANS